MSSDQVLEYLVQKTEETSIGINITLTINGLVIVGELISSKNYYDYMSGLFEAFTEKSKEKIVENTATPDSNEQVKIETQNIYREDFKELMIKMRSKKNQENGEPKYIHLRNVEVWEIFSTEPFRFEIGVESCRL
jgi:adenine-specific DNA methylase